MGDDHRSKIIEDVWNERFYFGKPWVRYTIIILPDGSKNVVIKMDHAVYDGTLLRIFYAQFAAIQHETPLPSHEKFRDFTLHMWRGDKTKSMKFWIELRSTKRSSIPLLTSQKSRP